MEDTKVVMGSRKSEDRQYNDQKEGKGQTQVFETTHINFKIDIQRTTIKKNRGTLMWSGRLIVPAHPVTIEESFKLPVWYLQTLFARMVFNLYILPIQRCQFTIKILDFIAIINSVTNLENFPTSGKHIYCFKHNSQTLCRDLVLILMFTSILDFINSLIIEL